MKQRLVILQQFMQARPKKFQSRKIKLQSGDIFINNKVKITKPLSDPFLSYKQSYQLPVFQSKEKFNTLDLKRRLRSLESRPNRYRLKSNLRSKTIVGDELDGSLIRKQLFSIDLGDNDSVIRNCLDPKYLTEYEKMEIKKYKGVFYIGHKAHFRKHKDSFEDKELNYKPLVGDHIAYRFEIVKVVGSGAFGKVLEVIDHKYQRKYALKILKASEELYQQFKLEVAIMKVAKEHPSTNKNIVQLKGDFEFRGHICIVTELLSANVYAYIKSQNYEGFSVEVVRKILIQVMQALMFLHHKHIIHCDIKPENLVFKESGKSGVKLIDFGSACFESNKEFTYIQSRYYRSPEIVLMRPYDNKIDVWSLGCLIFQIYTGSPLFPSRTQDEQMQMLLTTLGAPPKDFLSQCQRARDFDFSRFQGKAPQYPLRERMKEAPASLCDLMQKMVKWSPKERLTVPEAMLHDFILEGLPKFVRDEHIKQMESASPYGLY